MKIINADCLVIGSGIAGSLYAYIAAKAGLKCVLVSSADIDACNSALAQGGIIYEKHPDLKALLKDIQMAGGGKCNEEAILAACSEGFKDIEKYFIKEFDTDFNRAPNGELLLTKEAAHSKKRIIFKLKFLS